MRVRELIAELSHYNFEADVTIVIADGHSYPIDCICFGNSEGCTMFDCETVSLYIGNGCEDRAG